MPKLLAVLMCCLAPALIAVGCGSSDKNNGGGGGNASTSTPKAKPAAPANAAKGAKTAAVSMKNTQFNPAKTTVKVGGTVTWTNDDSFNHDVTKQSGPGKDFKSGQGNLAQGATYKQTLSTPGAVKYVCTIHPGMQGEIDVVR